MATRYIRDTTILAKIETTSGTDSIPTGAANAMAVSNCKITPLNGNYVSRALLRNYFGTSEELLATFNKLVEFDVEAVGSGTAGAAPAWDPLIRSAGFAATATATERVEYKPITNSQESCSIYYYDAGLLHKLLYGKAGLKLNMGLGNIPKLTFAFLGIDGGDTSATPSGVSFTTWQQPQVVTDQFSGDVVIGGSYTAPGAAPAITAGTIYPSTGLEIDFGIKPEYIPLLGGQSVDITNRDVKAKTKLDATVAQEIAFYTAIQAGTLQSVGMIHGSVVGKRFGVFGAKGQFLNPSKEEIQGKRLIGYDIKLLPTTGNDEITIVTSF